MNDNTEKPINDKKNRGIRIIAQIGLVALVLLLVYFALESVLPGVVNLIANGTGDDVRAFLLQFHDFKGYAVGFMLQFIQIITIILPSVPIQIASGVVFGVWRGFAVCYLGYVSANAVIFLASRKLGAKLEKLLPTVSSKKTEKKKTAILDSEHPAFMVLLATTFPLLPNGIIPYAASKTRVRFSTYMAAVGLGCIPTILTLCAVGKELLGGDFLSAALYTLPLLMLFVLFYWQKDRLIAFYSRFISWHRKRKAARLERKNVQH